MTPHRIRAVLMPLLLIVGLALIVFFPAQVTAGARPPSTGTLYELVPRTAAGGYLTCNRKLQYSSPTALPTEVVVNENPANPLEVIGFTNKIVTCVENILNYAITRIDLVRASVANIVATCMSLYIIFLGYRAVFGDLRRMRADLIIPMLTLTVMAYFVYGVGVERYILLFMDSTEVLMDTVFNAATLTSGYCTGYTTWLKIDCIIALFLGIKGFASGADLNNPANLALVYNNPAQYMGLTPFLTALATLFTPFGVIILITVVIVMFLMAAIFAQAVVIYIAALMSITLLGVVAPIIIPLYLFGPTKGIFQKWVAQLIGNTLKPMILMGYIAFMVSVLTYMFDYGPTGNGSGLMAAYGLTAAPSPAFPGTTLTQASIAANCQTTEDPRMNPPVTLPATPTTGAQVQCDVNAIAAQPDPQVRQQLVSPTQVQASANTNQTGMYLPSVDMSIPDMVVRIFNFMMLMLISVIILALTFGFMDNVIDFGGQITGMGNVMSLKVTNYLKSAASNVAKLGAGAG